MSGDEIGRNKVMRYGHENVDDDKNRDKPDDNIREKCNTS
jgi:hypothetical protein